MKNSRQRRATVRHLLCGVPGLLALIGHAHALDWQILTINGERAAAEAAITFNVDGQFSGTSGCNRFRGAATIDGEALVVTGPVTGTRMACPGETLARQDDALIGFFQGRIAVAFDPLQNQLTLSREDASVVLYPELDMGPGYPRPHSGRERPAGEPPYVAAFGIQGDLEIRGAANPQAALLGSVYTGTVLRNAGCTETGGMRWCEVSLPDGSLSGWARGDVLEAATADLRAGQGVFDAGGYIPCAGNAGAPMTQCGFGVARDGGGTATVVVTRPDGRRRALFFVDGNFLSADTSEADGGHEITATRESDLNFIRVNNERYEIPDAVPFGG